MMEQLRRVAHRAARGAEDARGQGPGRGAAQGRHARLADEAAGTCSITQVLAWHFEAGLDPVFVCYLFDVRRLLELETVRLAAKLRTADHIRMLYYWLQQMSVSRGMADSFALATLELHRVLADAAQNPMLRAALGVTEFTLAAAMPEGDGRDDDSFYETAVVKRRNLVQSVEAGKVAEAEACLLEAIEVDFDSARVRMAGGASPDAR